ncbi:MAG: hypothetical protein ACRC1T_00010 [Clostridium chrysemydis]|uniref:hypothetical protein n=1 Tax=Clostridium chrysemydis TaxID=2665504 RepID=UPI003F36BDA8
MELRELLEKYNNCTLKAMEFIKEDKDIEEFVIMREKLLENFKDLEFSKEEGLGIANELNIFKNDEKLNKMIINKKIEIKNEIELIKKRRLARQNYGNYASKPVYFNKKI